MKSIIIEPSEEIPVLEDADGDGYLEDEDCDDTNPLIHTGAVEVCDGLDNNCDGNTDEGVLDTFFADEDGDGFGFSSTITEACESPTGYVPISGDCDDGNATIYPAAEEICDGLDNDCDEDIDEYIGSLFFVDADDDGFGKNEDQVWACDIEQGLTTINGDCDDNNASINPDAEEICDELDNNCDGDIDENIGSMYYMDSDNDGYGADIPILSCTEQDHLVLQNGDCNDQDSEIHPDKEEICDGIDNDCNGDVDDGASMFGIEQYIDGDGDGYGNQNSMIVYCLLQEGYVLLDGDCDDLDSEIHPDKEDICDGIDNNCDTNIDENLEIIVQFIDVDQDGYGDDESNSISDCMLQDGYVTNQDDCDDMNIDISPDKDEICDGIDNNCDTVTDDDAIDRNQWYLDQDSDGYGTQNSEHPDPETTNITEMIITSCIQPENYVLNNEDCDDDNVEISPESDEICDGLDNNCNDLIDDEDQERIGGSTFYLDQDGDGFGVHLVTTQTCVQPEGYSNNTLDCDDSTELRNPDIPETCDGIDNNCNVSIDEGVQTIYYYDGDSDGFGLSSVTALGCDVMEGFASWSGDCNDENENIHPQNAELCNGLDDNCNNLSDEGIDVLWYYDQDGDGFGIANSFISDCEQPDSIFVASFGDCNPTDPNIYPSAPEVCDGQDHNCDGLIDFDADEDGFSDINCGGDDCDDENTLANPLNGCPQGIDCLDILQNDSSATDGIYLIDPDGSAIGMEPYEVYCDMSGGGWMLVYHDDFEQSTSQWTNNTRSSCGTFGNILGGYNIFGTGATVQNSIQNLTPHSEAKITFDFLRLDSWDGEYAYLQINGTGVWSKQGHATQGSMICGAEGVGGYWFYGRDEKWSESIQLYHSANTLTLYFYTTINQPASDESWGIDNVYVWIK